MRSFRCVEVVFNKFGGINYVKYVYLYWIICLWYCYYNCINDVFIVWLLMVINVCIVEKRRWMIKSWWFFGGIGLRIIEYYYGILYFIY